MKRFLHAERIVVGNAKKKYKEIFLACLIKKTINKNHSLFKMRIKQNNLKNFAVTDQKIAVICIISNIQYAEQSVQTA